MAFVHSGWNQYEIIEEVEIDGCSCERISSKY